MRAGARPTPAAERPRRATDLQARADVLERVGLIKGIGGTETRIHLKTCKPG